MKSILLVAFLLVGIGLNSFGQVEKAELLKKNDPLVGFWQFEIQSKTDSPAPILDSEEFIWLRAGNEESHLACCFSDYEQMYGCPSYFVAKKDKTYIYGNLSSTCILMLQGQDFKFEYRYDKKNDKLIVIVEGKEYIYKRIKE